MTDSQKQKVYDAEQGLRGLYDWLDSEDPTVEVGGVRLTLPPEGKFGSVESVQAYVDSVQAMPRVIAELGVSTPVSVRKRKGAKFAHYQLGTIAVHDGRDNWAMREIVVLHELAHHYSIGHQHGPKFASVFLTLLTNVMGPQVGLALRILFDEHGVKTK